MDREDVFAFRGRPQDLLAYATAVDGRPETPTDVYVNGVPGDLPPVQLIGTLAVNEDPFSAERANGTHNQVDVTMGSPDRALKLGLTGLPITLARRAGGLRASSVDRSMGLLLTGPIGHTALAFSFHVSLDGTRSETPMAVGPAVVNSESHRDVAAVGAYYTGAGQWHGNVTASVSHATASRLGGGVFTVPASTVDHREEQEHVRAFVARATDRMVMQGNAVWRRSTSVAEAEAIGPTIEVLDWLIDGGPALTASRRQQDAFLGRWVLQSPSGAPRWAAGVTVSRTSLTADDLPSVAGTLRFGTVDAYQRALNGEATGVRFKEARWGPVSSRQTISALFGEATLVQWPWLVGRVGIRHEHASTGGGLWCPRFSVAAPALGGTIRAGWGVFGVEIPDQALLRVKANEGGNGSLTLWHDAAFTDLRTDPPPRPQVVHSELAIAVRPRTDLLMASFERSLGGVAFRVQAIHADSAYLLGSHRLPSVDGWRDVVQSNRASRQTALLTSLRWTAGAHALMLQYEWSRARSNTDGPFSYPEARDARGEWARSSDLAPHAATIAERFRLAGRLWLSIVMNYRSSSPHNVITGLDPEKTGLFTHRGGLPRNAGSCCPRLLTTLYGSGRVTLPKLFGGDRRLVANIGMTVQNLFDAENVLQVGGVVGSPLFGRPVAMSPGRTLQLTIAFDTVRQ